MTTSAAAAKKPHICPPSKATHPRDRWESLFVYSFICKFTNLRFKVDGLQSPMDLEEALLANNEPSNILIQILTRFVLNLRPQTRNLSSDVISSTVASVISEYCKTNERLVFWDEDRGVNVDPFQNMDGGFFSADWDMKLKILRQLVELQLAHSIEIKAKIDKAWGITTKKKDAPTVTDEQSQEELMLLPVGQDIHRKRYWVTDTSPRVYMSSNPWKFMSCTFEAVSSTRDEYMTTIAKLRTDAVPIPAKKDTRSKAEKDHQKLIDNLESRVEAIDAEIARAQRARRKLEQKMALYAQAELRQTRTRRQAGKPKYVYKDESDSDQEPGDADDYRFQEEPQDDEEFEHELGSDTRKSSRAIPAGSRRSARATVVNATKKREDDEDPWNVWRGERRSTRLGAPADMQPDEPPSKRARTEESTTSDDMAAATSTNGVGLKVIGAAALKPTEVALEQIQGKKKSKYWVYAVEPAPGADIGTERETEMEADSRSSSEENGHPMDIDSEGPSETPGPEEETDGNIPPGPVESDGMSES